MRDKAAEIFVERYRAFSSQQHPRIPRNAEKNLLVLGLQLVLAKPFKIGALT